jgi:hypothetical protein
MEFSFKQIAIAAGTLIVIPIIIRLGLKYKKNSDNKVNNVGRDVNIGDKK